MPLRTLPECLLLVLLAVAIVSASVPRSEDSHSAESHDRPQQKRALVKCFQCYEANSTVTGVCTKDAFCEGGWCVKGPDSGGIFRGCMDRLPFKEQIPKCVIVKGQDGEDNENCYCNTDYCNSAAGILLSTFLSFSLLALFSL